MGQILHGSATTTYAIRTAIQRSKAPLKELSERYGLNPKTVAKWKKRTFVHDAPMGPKKPRSTVLSVEEEAVVVAFRRHTLLPLDDCLFALQATIPHLTRSSLHRCYRRHGISRLPNIEGDKPARKAFKAYPIGYFHIDIAEVRTEEGKLHLFVAIDRTSKFAFAELHEKATRETAANFMRALVAAVPTKSIPCSRTMALILPRLAMSVPRPGKSKKRWQEAKSSAPTPSNWPAQETISITASQSRNILGRMAKSSA